MDINEENQKLRSALNGWENWWNAIGFDVFNSAKIFDPKNPLGYVFRNAKRSERPPVCRSDHPLFGISSGTEFPTNDES